MRNRIGRHLVCPALLALASCSSTGAAAPSAIELATIEIAGGQDVDLLVIEPETIAPNAPVIVVFPWGSGDLSLTGGILETYWDGEAPRRGYIVIGVVTSTLDVSDNASALMDGVLDFLDQNFDYDRDRLILTGASRGGRDVFHAALARTEQVAGLIGMPAQWTGEARALAPLADVAVRLFVGENDTPWRDGTDATAEALMDQGVTVQVDVIAGQGHVLSLDEADLTAWIDTVLRR